MRVINNVSISIGELSPCWLRTLGRPEIEPEIEENIPATLRSPIDRVGLGMDELFSHDVSGRIALRLVPSERVLVLEGELQILETSSETLVRCSLEALCDSANRLAEKMQPGQRLEWTVSYGAEQFQQAQAA